MFRCGVAIATLGVCLQLTFALVVELDCGNTLVGGKGNGDYSNVCVRDHRFTDSDGQNWNFFKSKVRNTKFNGVTFKGEHNFEQTEWEDVEFNDCNFEGTGRVDTLFTTGTMKKVTFNNCKFESSAKVAFESLSIDNVSFNDCTILTDITFKSSSGKDLSVSKSTVGGFENSFTFQQATMDGLKFQDTSVTSHLRFHESQISDLEMKGSTTAIDFFCGKLAGGTWSEQSTFINADLDGLKLKNFQCGQSTWNTMKLSDVQVSETLAFDGATLKNVDWTGVTRNTAKSTSESCGLIDMSFSTISDGDKFSGISSCNTTFRGAKFTNPVDFGDMDVTNVDIYNFRNAEFAQTCVGNVTCTSLCATASDNPICKCASSKETDVDCTKAGSNVDDDANDGLTNGDNDDDDDGKSCFPADSSVTTEDGKLVRMEDLSHTHRVAVGGGEHSDVFFFGHRNPTELSTFVHIQTTSSGKELRLSPGHYLYANSKLVTARTVVVGDKLETGNGEAVTVTSIRTQLARGIFAPATVHGNLVVDGIVVSSYTDALHPRVAHTLLAPLRVAHQLGLTAVTRNFHLLHTYSAAPIARFFGFAGPPAVVHI